jgi:hypothetical protein
VAQEDLSIRFKVALDAGNAISEAKEAAAGLRDIAKAGGEVALAEKRAAAEEYAQQQRAFHKQNRIVTPTPDTSRVVQESAIGGSRNDKPAPDIAGGIRALEDALSSIESAKQRSMDRGDLSSARKYEQLYVSTNRQYRGEMRDYEKESSSFEKIKAESDTAEQKRNVAAADASKAADEKALKNKEYDDATSALQAAREEAKRTAKIAADESAKDPDSESTKTAAKAAKSAEENATQSEQAAEKASLSAKEAEEKYTAAKQKAAKATQDAEAKQAALEKAAEQRRGSAAEHALKLGNIATDAHAGQKAIGVKAQEEDEAHKDQLTRTMRGISKAINRGSGYIGQAGGGNAVGAAIGAAGDVASILPLVLGLGPVGAVVAAVGAALAGLAAAGNKLSEQWEKVMQPSMALTASLGELSDDARRNSLAFKDAFSRATDSKVLHGYTNEEGLALANQMAKMGVGDTSDVISAEEQVFRWQRETDADRGTLAQAVGMAGRYRGGEDVLGYVGGLKESGMHPGQYQEYLNATLRIFEEGLSRGVVKGFAEITRTQNMLAQIGTTWQGEQGAEKYQRMEDAVTSASDLQGDYDTILYKAAQSLMEQGKEKGDSGNYVDVAKVLDKGLTPALLNAALGTMSQNAGGDTQSTILQIMKGFNLSATSAEEVYKFWKQGDMTQAQARIEGAKSNGAESVEKHLLTTIESIKADVSLIGSEFTPLKDGVLTGLGKIANLLDKDPKKTAAHDVSVALEAVGGVGGSRHTEAMAAAFQRDELGSGGYADNVVAITSALAGVEPAIQHKIDQDPRLKRYLFRGLDTSEDYTDEAVERFRQELGEITAPTSVKPQDVGLMGFGQEWNTAATRTDNAASQQYAASVWDRYGSLAEYKKSQEYQDMREALNKRKEGGLTEAEIKMAADIVIGSYKDRLETGMGQIEYYGRNLSDFADPYDKEYGTLQSTLKSASELPGISEVLIKKVNEAIEATTSTSSPSGAVIDSGEIKSLIDAIHALIPALKENAEFDVEVSP